MIGHGVTRHPQIHTIRPVEQHPSPSRSTWGITRGESMTIHRTTMHRASLHRTTRRAAVADGRRHPGDAGHDIRRAVRSTVGERILHRLATEQGDVPGWVLITLMTAGIVVALWAVASEQIVQIFTNAMAPFLGGSL